MRVSILAAVAPSLVAGGVLPRTANPKGALYFLDNDPSGASVISLQIAQDGSLSNPVRTLTGGKGLYGSSATGPLAADTLLSQDSVVVSHSRLLTVSAGSDTVSLFNIPADDASHPALVGKPFSSGGSFPNSVAYSPALRLACVVNTGSPKPGIACFSVPEDSSGGELVPTGNFIPLLINQTTSPPVGPPDTASDIVFNPSSTALFVTVKGDGSSPGYIYAFPIKDGKVYPSPVVSRPPDLLLDFSLSFLGDDSHALITDPSYGAALVRFTPDLRATVATKIAITGQKASCWSVYDAHLGVVFVLDGGSPNVTAVDAETGAVRFVMDARTTAAAAGGLLDGTLAGGYLYVLRAGVAGVSVFDVREEGCENGKKNGAVKGFVQDVDLSALGSSQGWQGMAAHLY